MDFRRSRLALPQRLLEPLDRDRLAHFPAMSEAICHRLGHAEDFHRHAFDHVRLERCTRFAASARL